MKMFKILQCGLLGALSCFVAFSPAFAGSCPILSGTFDCPAAGNQPAMTLTVTNRTTLDGGMSYRFSYRLMGRDISSEADALPTEAKAADQANLCNGGAYIHKLAGAAGDGTRSSINAAGNFERASGGKVEMICVRTKS